MLSESRGMGQVTSKFVVAVYLSAGGSLFRHGVNSKGKEKGAYFYINTI